VENLLARDANQVRTDPPFLKTALQELLTASCHAYFFCSKCRKSLILLQNRAQITGSDRIKCISLCTLVSFSRLMQILFAISILCFMALLWAGFAIARHIRRGHERTEVDTSSRRDFAQHLYTAAEETRLPRVVRHQSVRDVTARKSWNTAATAVQIPPSFNEERTGTMDGWRKSPQSSQSRSPERLDWVYFNKDAGDLSDPYQPRHARGASSAQATSNRRY